MRVGYSHTKLSEVRRETAGGEIIRQIGMPVYAAGQFEYGGGLIHKINNASGHYQPKNQSPSLIEIAFNNAGLRHLFPRGRSAADVYDDSFK